MLLVLGLLCAVLSVATYGEQPSEGAGGGERLAEEVISGSAPEARVLIVVRDTPDDSAFAAALARGLSASGRVVVGTVKGQPADARQALDKLAQENSRLDVIAAHPATAAWSVLDERARLFPQLGGARLLFPTSYRWPTFLKASNLLNIANQIAVIAIVAVGMTMVIITGGIDLSVGSLMALSAVVAALLIREVAGAQHATTLGMVLCCGAAILACGVVGLFSGGLSTLFDIAPFITTLGVMLAASGLAYILSDNQSIYEIPGTFIWLGRGADLAGIPNAVVLVLVLYVAAHFVMTRATWGRYLYAVGSNRTAAKLSGIRVGRVITSVYVLSGLLAGLGGVVLASQLRSGAPTYGKEYELTVISAVVVGGTSLSGGQGKILGTLIGAFIIAVVQNGMNLLHFESNWQRVVLGAVLLGAVLLDKMKRRIRWLRSDGPS
jgi:ribose transport system permease protein